ncbi:MAG: phosphatidylserine decarboxylase [Myxococcales bacterium]|nr:phosphatidylserine decarboxylase [Myxococcales bacterium]
MATPTKVALDALSWPVLSRIYGRLTHARLPKPVLQSLIRRYIAHYEIDMSEYARPVSDYKTMDDFFTRALREGVRPIDTEEPSLIACADGRLSCFETITDQGLFQVKDVRYSTNTLLGNEELAQQLNGGTHYTVYLAPKNYHRVHSPWNGTITAARYWPGRLYPVNDTARYRVPDLFCRNERISLEFNTPQGVGAVVMVGASFVGQMSLSFTDFVTNQKKAGGPHIMTFAKPIPVARGQEVGIFHMGSTAVVLHQASFQSIASDGQDIRMGERLGALEQ